MIQVITLPVGPVQANCYILFNEENHEALIVDPGAEAEKIVETLAERQAFPVAILLTHTHYDHIGAVDEIRERYDIPVYVAPEEANWLEDPSKNLSIVSHQTLRVEKPDDLFEPEETIRLADFTFKVVPTPGHSPGGVSFVFDADEFVVTGDALFAGGVGRTDLPGSAPEQLLTGIRENIFSLPPAYTIYPGHGPSSTVGREIKTNPFFK